MFTPAGEIQEEREVGGRERMAASGWSILDVSWFGDVQVELCELLGHRGLERGRATPLGIQIGGVISIR